MRVTTPVLPAPVSKGREVGAALGKKHLALQVGAPASSRFSSVVMTLGRKGTCGKTAQLLSAAAPPPGRDTRDSGTEEKTLVMIL